VGERGGADALNVRMFECWNKINTLPRSPFPVPYSLFPMKIFRNQRAICVCVTFHYVPKALIWYNIDDRRYPYE
jgi:hypothetical protein